jgi:catechol-2,3-dioxygenase
MFCDLVDPTGIAAKLDAEEWRERMVPVKLDHCVIHVTEWERSNAFYTRVLGAELIAITPGFMMATRTLNAFISCARHSLNASKAHLEAA